MRRPVAPRGLLTALLLILGLPVAASAVVAELSGIVRNVENREPVVGAVVRAASGVAVTGPSGDYLLRLPLPGRYVVRVESETYHDAEKTVAAEAGPYDLNFELAPRRATARVYGTVYDRLLARPVARAEVSLDGVALRTNPEGQFVFTAVDPGDRWLSAAAAGYKVTARNLRVDAENEKVDLYLVPDVDFAKVSGRVLDRVSSLPVPLAVVQLGDGRAVTDRDGRFDLPEAMPAPARLLVKADGYWKYDDRLAIEPGTTDLKIFLEPSRAPEILAQLRSRVQDDSRVDWAGDSCGGRNRGTPTDCAGFRGGETPLPARVETVRDGIPEWGARSVAVATAAPDLKPHDVEIRRMAERADALPGESFIRVRAWLAPGGEYAGFIAFLYNEASRTVRNVSLRAEGNPQNVLLTRAVYRFRREADGLALSLRVGDWSGEARVAPTGRVTGFDITLDRAAVPLATPIGALVAPPPPVPPAPVPSAPAKAWREPPAYGKH